MMSGPGVGATAATSATDAHGVEAERQRQLLALLWGQADAIDPGLAGPLAERRRGLAVYRANAAALAPRALAAAYPTVLQLLGEESFAALARSHWHHHPPQRGDLAHWGAELAQAIETDLQLRGEPYLADIARLDWAMHRAGFEADDSQPPQGLPLLASADPTRLRLLLRAGAAVVVSKHPIVEIWQAHHSVPGSAAELSPDRFAQARRALQQGQSQAAWVVRTQTGAVQVLSLNAAGADFVSAVIGGSTLEQALQQAGASFDFEAWLLLALRQQVLAQVQPVA